ncbi:MAG: hypothetical protein HUU23_12370 [Caldilineales bacterium]|nr:hypothetical protein [Caldilineales bacterium]
MSAHSVTVDLPEVLFRKVERAAEGLGQPVSLALLKIVESSLPSLDKVPSRYRGELEAMETWTDQQLWRAAREETPAAAQQERSDLLRKHKQAPLGLEEEAHLDRLQADANRLMLRKSYALALLKWRGHKIPAFTTA